MRLKPPYNPEKIARVHATEAMTVLGYKSMDPIRVRLKDGRLRGMKDGRDQFIFTQSINRYLGF